MGKVFYYRRSIRFRLIVGFLLAQLFAVGIVGLLWYSSEKSSLLNYMDEEQIHWTHALRIHVDAEELNRLAEEGAQSPSYRKYSGLGALFARHSGQVRSWIFLGDSPQLLTVAFIYPETHSPGSAVDVPEGSFGEALSKALAGESAASGIYEDDAGTWKAGVSPLYDREGRVIGVVGVDTDAASIAARLARLRLQVVALTLVILALAGLVGVFIANGLAKYIVAATDFIRSIAAGDLTVDEMQVDTRDEIGQMGTGLNVMLRSWRGLLEGVQSSATAVAQAAEELDGAAAQSAQATGGAAQAVQHLASGASEQARDAAEVSEVMEQLQQTIQQIASGSQQMAGDVQEALGGFNEMVQAVETVAAGAAEVKNEAARSAETAQRGDELVRRSVIGVQDIKRMAEVSAQHIRDLHQLSDEIGKITEVISGIADQTNLLALNAAIEAARAGDHGRGFAVVAEEVRKLAERSDASAKEIAELIADIQGRTAEAVDSMEQVTAQALEQAQGAEEAGEMLQVVLTLARTTAEHVEEISEAAEQLRVHATQQLQVFETVAAVTEQSTAATEEMSAAATQVSEAVRKVAPIAQQNAHMAEELASTIEEISASAQEVSASANHLADVGEELLKHVARFKL
ncbi:MAG: methyl-accepting chemotaxis protein [Limnochordia bacterium]